MCVGVCVSVVCKGTKLTVGACTALSAFSLSQGITRHWLMGLLCPTTLLQPHQEDDIGGRRGDGRRGPAVNYTMWST